MYQKEIIYLGLYKDGDRLGSAGFLKVEKRDKDGSLSLVVKNVPHSINGKYPVRYYSGSDWKETDGIMVREGGGMWERQEPESLEQVRLQIMLPGGYLVEGASKEAVRQERAAQGAAQGVAQGAEQEVGAYAGRATVSGTAVPRQEEAVAGQGVAQGAVQEVGAYTGRASVSGTAAVRREETVAVQRVAQGATQETAAQERPKKIERIVVQRQEAGENAAAQERTQKPLMADALVIEGLKEDKWEQILDTYDNIHPYGDERVYVKLAPKDFIIMSGKYQHLVNNSFLLHGFYNYRHVILGKEGEVYYLGVPGVFYEREKMVALMFGFEAFECGSRESKPGEFGYYLRKVEL